MDVVGQFIARYSKEYGFYDQGSRLAAGSEITWSMAWNYQPRRTCWEAGRRLQDMFEKLPMTPDEDI